MTQEEIHNKHIDIINHLIDISGEIEQVWKYHPENPNRIDVVTYHDILVNKMKEIEQQEIKFREKNGNINL